MFFFFCLVWMDSFLILCLSLSSSTSSNTTSFINFPDPTTELTNVSVVLFKQPLLHNRPSFRGQIFSEEPTTAEPVTPTVERGVSVDQDGKSNVWAIGPKMEVSSNSGEEKMTSALIAGGCLAAF